MGKNVNAILLDASRAFDRVNYVSLFILLKERKLCPVIIRFLIKMYTSQYVRVKWGTFISAMCSVTNGVNRVGCCPQYCSQSILMKCYMYFKNHT